MKQPKVSISYEEIYELREQGLSYEAIASYFDKKGIKTTWITIRRRCKRIYMEKGKEEPKVKREGPKRRKDITDEEIYELREQGMTYEAIAKFYEEKNIKVSPFTIRERCKSIYEQKGKEEPKVKREGPKRRKDITDEEIYELREQGMTYEAIASYFDKKGIKTTWNTIQQRCKRIYMEKGKEEPKVKRKGTKRRKDKTDEEIYELREQGMTYQEIASYFDKKGIKISCSTIRLRCKRIYMEKGKEEPKVKRKGPKRRKDITDKKIYELREQGLSYQEIASHFDKKGIKISWSTIRERCKSIYEQKGKEGPKAKYRSKINKIGVMDEDIYELREQGMTYEAIAKFYEEKNIKVSPFTIRERCKSIYEQKGKEEPRVERKGKKGSKDITDQEIYELREQGMSYREIERYFKGRGKEISFETIRKIVKKGEEEPRVERKGKKGSKDITDKEIYELREQGMTYQEIASFFDKKGIKISLSTIGRRCKSIQEQKGKEEPKVNEKSTKLKTGRKKQHKMDNKSLEKLNEELNEKIKKKLEMEKILNTLRDYIERITEGVEK